MLTGLAGAVLLAAKLEFVVPDANYSLREGLPAVQVISLYQDRHGALWAGTTGGLAQLGGPRIRAFGPAEGLARSVVFAIAEEADGTMLVGTASGIARLENGRFQPARVPPVAAQMAIRRFVIALDGTVWALAGDRTLLRLEGEVWHVVGIDGALAFEGTDFAVDDSGSIWLATRNHGLLKLSRSGTRFAKVGEYRAAGEGAGGIDHVATWKGKAYFTSAAGLSFVSGQTVVTAPFSPGTGVGHRAIAIDGTGRVFVGTNDGALALRDRALVPIESRNDRARSSAVALLFDREGQLWMGTIEGGLHVLLLGRGVRFLRSGKESFRSIDVDRSGFHWISNDRRILRFRTDDSGNPVHVADVRTDGFDASTIYGMEEDGQGGLIFALDGGVGVVSAASRNEPIAWLQHDSRFEALRDRLVTGVHRDPSGAIWATSPMGLFRLPAKGREAQPIRLVQGNPWMTAIDELGSLWVSTRQGTLDRIDTATLSAQNAVLPPTRRVEFLGPSPEGGVVATLDNGASIFLDARGKVRRTIPADGPDGLGWLSVLSLYRMGDKFLAAHQGDRLSQIGLDPPRVEKTLLTSADLEDSDFRYLGLREGRPGQVWFSLLNGVGLLDPPNAPPEPSRLMVEPGASSYTLPPRPNALDLAPLLADPVAPRKARYRWRLLGDHDSWSEWTDDPHIPLANVAPGSYTLEVEGQDRYGRKSRTVSIQIDALPHFWESWPFRLAAALAFFGLGALLYQRRIRAIQADRIALAAAVRAGREDLEAANRRLQELSLTDVLTGLRNRRYFSEVVEDELALLKRRFEERASADDPNRDAVFFLLDLDHFKTVNDVFGHAGGDDVLKETARRLEKLLRKTDRLVRWGGEEFLVLSLDCRRAEASDLAMRIMTAVSGQPFAVGPPGGIAVTTSIGWAAYPFSAAHSDLQPEDAVRLADRALYRAKRGGRNCAVGIVDTEDPVGQDGKLTGTVEMLRDFGFSVGFRLARGAAQTGGKNIESLQGSGPRRRPPMA